MDTDAPLYVSSIDGAEHAVSIWLPGEHGPEKVSAPAGAPGAGQARHVPLQRTQGVASLMRAAQLNCQLIIDKDRIDFVQLRVRVRSEDFIGITAIKDSKSHSKLLVREGGRAPLLLGRLCRGSAEAEDAQTQRLRRPAQCAQADEGSQQGSSQHSEGGGDAAGAGGAGGGGRGRFRIYLKGREQRPVEFEASHATRSSLHRHTQRWLGQDE